MAIPMVCALCALVIVKPQEFIPLLIHVPLVHALFAMSVAIGMLDAMLGKIRPTLAPHTMFVFAFFAWGALVTLVRKPQAFSRESVDLAVVLCVFMAITTLAGTPSGVRNVCFTFLLSALFASTVAILQADAPLGCMMAAPDDWEGKSELEYDGRPCETSIDCRKDPPIWNANYRCEHVGPLGTSSIGGRVRYRGTLADPNDLSLAAAVALPFALALAERTRRANAVPDKPIRENPAKPSDGLSGCIGDLVRFAPALAAIGVVGTMIVLSKSRMGVVVFLLVMGMALLRRAGAWGMVLGFVLLPPVVVLGGRSGADAAASSQERLDLLAEALSMIRHSRGIGVGVGQFADESSMGLTAHNSYLLAASETGIIGISLFALMLYMGLKVPVTLWFGSYQFHKDVRRFAPAIAMSLVGTYVGMFFLSWTYKEVLFILLGASGALYQAARAEDSQFRVKLTAPEAVVVVFAALSFAPVVYAMMRVLG